jgi:hypothetical protein
MGAHQYYVMVLFLLLVDPVRRFINHTKAGGRIWSSGDLVLLVAGEPISTWKTRKIAPGAPLGPFSWYFNTKIIIVNPALAGGGQGKPPDRPTVGRALDIGNRPSNNGDNLTRHRRLR